MNQMDGCKIVLGISITQIEVRMSKSRTLCEIVTFKQSDGIELEVLFANLPTSRPYIETIPINITCSQYFESYPLWAGITRK